MVDETVITLISSSGGFELRMSLHFKCSATVYSCDLNSLLIALFFVLTLRSGLLIEVTRVFYLFIFLKINLRTELS